MIAGALVLPATIAGMIEASTAPKPSHAARESTIGRRASSIPPPPPASPASKPMAQLLDVHIMNAVARQNERARRLEAHNPIASRTPRPPPSTPASTRAAPAGRGVHHRRPTSAGSRPGITRSRSRTPPGPGVSREGADRRSPTEATLGAGVFRASFGPAGSTTEQLGHGFQQLILFRVSKLVDVEPSEALLQCPHLPLRCRRTAVSAPSTASNRTR